MTSRVVAIILAGGVGTRFGDDRPKQFAKVAGKTLIEHTLKVFHQHPQVDEITVVSKAEFNHEIMNLVTRNQFTKVTRVINGGAERTDSTRAALTALGDYKGDTSLLIHDAVRPFVTPTIITGCIKALETHRAVDVVIDSADTIVQVNKQGLIENIPDRKWMKRGQTPQAFKLDLLRKAYRLAAKKGGIHATCDCGIVLKTMPEEPVTTVLGHASNIKVTDPIDLFIADKLFQIRGQSPNPPRVRPEKSFKGKVLVIFGGNSGIGQAIAQLATDFGARVHCYSRSTTNTDIARKSAVTAALAAVSQQEGQIDMVVNTAAVLFRKSLNLTQENEVDQVIDVNFKGTVNVASCAHPHLKRSGGALLLFTSSSYTRGREYYSLYSATKCAVVNFMQAIAEEWINDGIRVNCINPERTATPMRSANFGNEPAHTLLSPQVVAQSSLETLASEATGHVVDIRLD